MKANGKHEGRWLTTTAADAAKTVGYAGPRLKTGLPTLDRALRGGFPFARIITLTGRPSLGKTMLELFWGWVWAKTLHVPVLFLCYDAGRDDALVRIGQHEGLSAEKLDRADPEEQQKLAKVLASNPSWNALNTFTIEGAAELLYKYRGERGVLIVDSIQKARTEADGEFTATPRSRVDAVMQALKLARDKWGHLILATSEVSRGYYDKDAQRDELATGKDSGSVEYDTDFLANLRGTPDPSVTRFEVTRKVRSVAKDSPSFFFRMHNNTQRFEESAGPGPTEDAPDWGYSDRILTQVVGVVAQAGTRGVCSSDLRNAVTGDHATINAAINQAIAEGHIHKCPEGRKVIYRLTANPRANGGTPDGGSQARVPGAGEGVPARSRWHGRQRTPLWSKMLHGGSAQRVRPLARRWVRDRSRLRRVQATPESGS